MLLTFVDAPDQRSGSESVVQLASEFDDLFEGCPFATYVASTLVKRDAAAPVQLMCSSPIWNELSQPNRRLLGFREFADWLIYCDAHSLNIPNMMKHAHFWAGWMAEDWTTLHCPSIASPTESYWGLCRHYNVFVSDTLGVQDGMITSPKRPMRELLPASCQHQFFDILERTAPNIFLRLIEKCHFSAAYYHVPLVEASIADMIGALGIAPSYSLWTAYEAELQGSLYVPALVANSDWEPQQIRPMTRLGWSFRIPVDHRPIERSDRLRDSYVERLRKTFGDELYDLLMSCPVEFAIGGQPVLYACYAELDAYDEIAPVIYTRGDVAAFGDWMVDLVRRSGRDILRAPWVFKSAADDAELIATIREQPLDCLRGWFLMGGGLAEPRLMGLPSFIVAMKSSTCLAPKWRGATPTSFELEVTASCILIGFTVLLSDEDADRLFFVNTDLDGRNERGGLGDLEPAVLIETGDLTYIPPDGPY